MRALYKGVLLVLLLAETGFISNAAAQSLFAAVLPASRSVQLGAIPATACFVTIINTGTDTATQCGIDLVTQIPATLDFQTTDPSTNQLTGTLSTRVDIPAGGLQTFAMFFTATAAFLPTDIEFAFDCQNVGPADTLADINTMQLSMLDQPVPDIVAFPATPNNNGIIDIPGTAGTAVFAAATINVGEPAEIVVTAEAGGQDLPVRVSLCQTDPATAACINPTTPTTEPVVVTIATDATPTFSVFVQGSGWIADDPAKNRVFLRFASEVSVNGSLERITSALTSVAVRSADEM